MNKLLLWYATGTCLALTAMTSPDVSAESVRKFSRSNAAGGTADGSRRVVTGPNGGTSASRRVIRSDGEGNATAGTGRVWTSPNGGVGGRAGHTTVGADGSVEHRSGVATSGAKGSVSSQGSSQRDADGNVTGARTTNATNAATGNSYQGQTSYDKATGVSHSASCFDAAGNAIACPSR